MRRYGRESADLIVPGRDAGMKLRLSPVAEPIVPIVSIVPDECVTAIAGLFWFSDATGDFTETTESAYLLPVETEGSPPTRVTSSPMIGTAAGPAMAVAKLTGEVCDVAIAWETRWSHDNEPFNSPSTGEPGIYTDGEYLIVSPLDDTETGNLTVTATANGVAYGPITLTVMRFACASCTSDITDIQWTSWDTGAYTVNIDVGAHDLRTNAAVASWNAKATITGTICPDCVFTWKTNAGLTRITNLTLTESAPQVDITITPSIRGTLTINLTITCDSGTFVLPQLSIVTTNYP